MSAILKFDLQKRKQLHFSEVNYLNYTNKDPILHVTTTFSLKQGETRTSSGTIPHPLKIQWNVEVWWAFGFREYQSWRPTTLVRTDKIKSIIGKVLLKIFNDCITVYRFKNMNKLKNSTYKIHVPHLSFLFACVKWFISKSSQDFTRKVLVVFTTFT